MNNLYKTIINNYPDYTSTIAEELTFLTEKHKLRWLLFKGEVYFIMNQVSKAKGLEAEHYRKTWYQRNLPLPGKYIKLEYDLLKEFKTLYKETYSESLGRIRSLWIGNYIHTYHYLKANTLANNPRVHFIEADIEDIYQKTFGGERQCKLTSGRTDIINGEEIIEIKKNTIDCNAVGQLLRYLTTTNRVKGKLVAPSITTDASNLINLLTKIGFQIIYVKVIIKKSAS